MERVCDRVRHRAMRSRVRCVSCSKSSCDAYVTHAGLSRLTSFLKVSELFPDKTKPRSAGLEDNTEFMLFCVSGNTKRLTVSSRGTLAVAFVIWPDCVHCLGVHNQKLLRYPCNAVGCLAVDSVLHAARKFFRSPGQPRYGVRLRSRSSLGQTVVFAVWVMELLLR